MNLDYLIQSQWCSLQKPTRSVFRNSVNFSTKKVSSFSWECLPLWDLFFMDTILVSSHNTQSWTATDLNIRCNRWSHCIFFLHQLLQQSDFYSDVRLLQCTQNMNWQSGSGIVVSFFTGGAFCGAGLAGPAGDKLGRRWTIIIGSLIYLLGGALQTAAQNISMLWAGRWLAGLGVGFLVMISMFSFQRIASES